MGEKEYIARLDAELDVALLEQELSIRWQCLLVLRIATCFLQKGAAADLSLYDIASMMSRDEYEKPSALEVVFAQAKTLAEGKRRGGNPKRRRSPNVSPAALPTPQPRKMRRSRSMCSLDFDAFKSPVCNRRPPKCQQTTAARGRSPTPARMCSTRSSGSTWTISWTQPSRGGT